MTELTTLKATDEARQKSGDYYITIGLEVHAALMTHTKLMSQAPNSFSTDLFAPVDAGLPGAMPVVCRDSVEQAVAFGLMFGARIPKTTGFDRKHYFYGDLAIGYQITQQFNPVVVGGSVEIELSTSSMRSTSGSKTISIEHAHLECDAAKSVHNHFTGASAIDISRGGTTLLEIVSTPSMHSPSEAVSYAQTLYEGVVALGICDGKMQEGSYRMDASISLSKSETELGTRVEIKNLSSFAYMKSALNYEITRQRELLERGEKVQMQTVLYDEDICETRPMRDKESVLDYRYMPDPDIPLIEIDQEFLGGVSEQYARSLCYFSDKSRLLKLLSECDIKGVDADVLVHLKEGSPTRELWTGYLDHLEASPRAVSIEEKIRFCKTVLYALRDVFKKYESAGLDLKDLKDLNGANKLLALTLSDVLLLSESKMSSRDMEAVATRYVNAELGAGHAIVNYMPQFLGTDTLLVEVSEVIAQYPEQVAQYLGGAEKLLQFITGKCMAKLKGKASAVEVQKVVKSVLDQKKTG